VEPSGVRQADPVEAGIAAMRAADWTTARRHFEAAVEADPDPKTLEHLSQAVWWEGDEEATFDVRERAYRAYREAGEAQGAARMAMLIGADYLDFRGDHAVAAAWLARVPALVDEPCPELGYTLLFEADIASVAEADHATAERKAREALEYGRELGDQGVEVVALALLGNALVARGQAAEGLGMIDQSAGLALGGDFEDPAYPGWALCHSVTACANVGDFERAHQWCQAMQRWTATWRARQYFGICRTAYGHVLATQGHWPDAEDELQSAIDDLRATRPALAAPSAVRLGELRVRQGRRDEGRQLFEAALPMPQAVLCIGGLDLDAGDAGAAADAADRVLRRLDDESLIDRVPALELLARARAAAGDHEGAAAATEELERACVGFGTPYMRGRARALLARVLAAAEDHDEARRAAEDAVDLFGECSAPYEAAQARIVLARSLKALGRAERAQAEGEAAREALTRLGADAEARRAIDAELSPRELEILRLIAEGLNDAEIAERLFLSRHTVHRHVANVRAKLRTPSRAAAVAEATRLQLL
jgi:ATP/maltotriose-dependent transcriptional regulator MalT